MDCATSATAGTTKMRKCPTLAGSSVAEATTPQASSTTSGVDMTTAMAACR